MPLEAQAETGAGDRSTKHRYEELLSARSCEDQGGKAQCQLRLCALVVGAHEYHGLVRLSQQVQQLRGTQQSVLPFPQHPIAVSQDSLLLA